MKTMRLVLVSKPGCQPCAMLKMVLNARRSVFTEVSIATDPKVVEEMKITSVPTLVAYNGETEVKRMVGYRNAQQLQEFLE